MKYNAQTGKELMRKYLGRPELTKRIEHSTAVGVFSSKVARKIAQKNPELHLDTDLCEFLGYIHDIGYSVSDEKHEVYTIDILQKEGVDPQTARKAMHGQLVEQFGEKEGNINQYMPKGIEGIILTYCDMSVGIGEPVTIKERATEIIERIKVNPTMSEQLKKDIEDNMHKALPRFERYEKTILTLAGVQSVKEFNTIIIIAPDFQEIRGPLVFLAGPIQGAENWQKIAIELILKENPFINIASPRGDYSKRKFDYNTQIDWETRYLNQAANTGAILFWLAKEKEHICNRAYAQTTRFELGEWIAKHKFNKNIKLSIGIEPGFSGEKYLRRRIKQDCPEIVIHRTLIKVCKDIIQKLKS